MYLIVNDDHTYNLKINTYYITYKRIVFKLFYKTNGIKLIQWHNRTDAFTYNSLTYRQTDARNQRNVCLFHETKVSRSALLFRRLQYKPKKIKFIRCN